MIRVIKRYESRKLYDTEESRYVSLEDLSRWVREGQEIRVVDNATSEDVSAQVLTQIILDEGKRGTAFLPTELLHELVRAGEKALSSGVEQVQTRVDRFVQTSIDRLGPVRQVREEMSTLRERLVDLERTLVNLEHESTPAPAKRSTRKATTRKPRTTKATTAKSATKSTAKATTAKKPAAAKKAAAKKPTATKTAAKAKAPSRTARVAKTAAAQVAESSAE